MFKSKVFLISCLLPIIAVIGVIGFAIFRDSKSQYSFKDSGYILVIPEDASSQEANTQIYFEEGTKYRLKYPNKIVFKDQNNKKIEVDADSFVHYNDGSISSLAKGVMVDLNGMDNSLVNYYGLNTDTVMQSAGSDYVLDNMGNSMSFNDFLWKINDNKYLLTANKISVAFSEDNVKDFENYVELNYYDSGIIRIVTNEGSWQTVSSNCTATIDNGMMLNLANRTVVQNDGKVKMSLEQMVVDSDENIDIIPSQSKNELARVPKFEIKTIDGTNGTTGSDGEIGEDGKNGLLGTEGEKGKQGEIGEAGEAGDPGENGINGMNGTNGPAGAPGEPGQTGITGINGNNGLNGLPGANGAAGMNGTNGSDGKDSSEQLEDRVTLPIFEVTDLDVKSSTVKGIIKVTDDGNLLNTNKDFLIQIIENSTGDIKYELAVGAENREIPFEYNSLVPNNEYTLIVTADYMVDNVNYNRIFVNKVFYTDTLGLTFEKSYAKSDTLAINIKKKEYSDVSAADIQLIDKDNTEISTKQIIMQDAEGTSGCTVVFDNLVSNTPYKVKVVNIKYGLDDSLVAPSELGAEEFYTLKLAPSLGNPEVAINRRNASFEMKLDSVIDKDGAIIRYRYEIYEIVMNEDDKLVKTLYNTTNDVMPCYVDEINIKHGYTYRLKIITECYDNEKNVEFASILSQPFSISGKNFPVVLFERKEDETHHERLVGNVRIEMKDCFLKADSSHPLIIKYQNTLGDTNTFKFENIGTYLTDGTYSLPFDAADLKASEKYIISVYGSLDLNDGVGYRDNTLIGTVITSTDTPAEFKAGLTEESNPTSTIAFYLNLSDVVDQPKADYEASTINSIELNLYDGDASAITKTRPIATYTLYDENNGDNDYYNSSLKDNVYGSDKSVLITEKEFGIKPEAINSSQYTVVVSEVRDYTRYANEFIINNNTKTFTKKAALPDLNSIDKNNGLIVTPITRATIGNYVNDPVKLNSYSKYDGDVILGYEVQAAYFDNSTDLVESFYYYAFEEADYHPGDSSQDFYLLQTYKNWQKVDVLPDTHGMVPKAIFLFGETGADQMSRGSRYVFTYRAKLKEADPLGSAYFPENKDPSVIIRSKTADTPYQAPKFSFYPWTSDANSTTWKYYISAPDSEVFAGQVFKASVGVTNKNVDFSSPVAGIMSTIRIRDLSRGNVYNLKLRINRYKWAYNSVYNTAYDEVLIGQTFEEIYTFTTEGTSLDYEMIDKKDQNRFIISINDAEGGQEVSRVVALNVEVEAVGLPVLKQTLTLSMNSVSENTGICFLRYSDLNKDFLGRTLQFTVKAIYDNGISGFMNVSSFGVNQAIQIIPKTLKGNYITLNASHNGISDNVNGKAMNSYFKFKGINILNNSITLTYDSLLDNLYLNKTLSLTTDQTGARFDGIDTRPCITLKGLSDVTLHIKESSEKVTTMPFLSMTPTVNLRRGSAYTIDTSVDSAKVNWYLYGHEALLDTGDIVGNKMYFELFKVSNTGLKAPTGRIIEIPVDKTNNYYSTDITGLEKNTRYAIQIYFMNKENIKVYPIDFVDSEVTPSSIYYPFTTASEIEIKNATVSYDAKSYKEKYLKLSYTLNQTNGFHIVYSICKKNNENYDELVSSETLSDLGIIRTPSTYKDIMDTEKLYIEPGLLKWTESGNNVYFPFNSTDYYLCIKPVSINNHTIGVGNPVYLQLNVPALSLPFYNVKSIPYKDKVVFNISIQDTSGVMVSGNYKIKVFDKNGADITPAGCKNWTYPINSPPAQIEVDGITDGNMAVLNIYTVYDMENTGINEDKTPITDIKDVAYDQLDDAAKGYLKESFAGYLLNKDYNLGDVEIYPYGTNLARVYFENSVNLNNTVKKAVYIIVNPSGGVSTYTDNSFEAEPVAGNSSSLFYQLAYNFNLSGTYQVQIRFYDGNNTRLDEDKIFTIHWY